jgi:hypothetical protein
LFLSRDAAPRKIIDGNLDLHLELWLVYDNTVYAMNDAPRLRLSSTLAILPRSMWGGSAVAIRLSGRLNVVFQNDSLTFTL